MELLIVSGGGGVVIVRKQHSRAGSDSSIEFVAVEDSPGMKLPPMSPTTSESSSEEVGLLVRPMTPTTSDDGIASEAENQSVANHTKASKTAFKHTATNEKLSRSSTSSDRVFQGTPIQSATSSPILDAGKAAGKDLMEVEDGQQPERSEDRASVETNRKVMCGDRGDTPAILEFLYSKTQNGIQGILR